MKKNLLNIILLITLTLIASCSTIVKGPESSIRRPASYGVSSNRLSESLAISREFLTRPDLKKIMVSVFTDRFDFSSRSLPYSKIPKRIKMPINSSSLTKILTENDSFFIEMKDILSEIPRYNEHNYLSEKYIQEMVKGLLSSLNSNRSLSSINSKYNPLHVMDLTPRSGPGYGSMSIYSGHQRIVNGQIVAGEDLRKIVIKFIRDTKKELMLNVYDFDLVSIADELIRKRQQGITVSVGIDDEVMTEKIEVQAIFDKLLYNGVNVVAVNSVSLNHQKMITRDWSLKNNGAILFSSANFTKSGMHPNGDIGDLPFRSKYSIPNANHIVVIQSDFGSLVVQNELHKTLKMKLRGKNYPIGGIYRLYDSSQSNYILLSFSPGGAYKSISHNLISQLILEGNGPMFMAQFAFSSQAILDAIFLRAQKELNNGRKFVFKSVGETPFALAKWSGFLKMSGLKSEKVNGKKRYMTYYPNRWKNILSADYKNFVDSVRVAPKMYGMYYKDIRGKKLKLTSKLHHKIMITDQNSVIMGTSFNFSKGADRNNEQVLVIHDRRAVNYALTMIDYLYQSSGGTVYSRAMSRNN